MNIRKLSPPREAQATTKEPYKFASPYTLAVLTENDRMYGKKAPCFRLQERNVTTCLPSFSIVGIAKSGTSAMYYYLNSHPQIVRTIKEKCFHVYGAANYVDYLNTLPEASAVCSDCILYDSCIGFGAHPKGPLEYRKLLPTINNLILLMRHPVHWMYAGYWFWCLPEEQKLFKPDGCDWNPREPKLYLDPVTKKKEYYAFLRSPEDFHERLTTNPGSLRYPFSTGYPTDRTEETPYFLQYYRDYVQNILAVYPRHELMVFTSEEFYENTVNVLEMITDRVGLRYHNYTEIASVSVNVNGRPGVDATADRKEKGSYPSVLAKTLNHFHDGVKELCEELEHKLEVVICKYWIPK